MREKGCASWDRAQGHMGRLGEGLGTVPVRWGAQEWLGKRGDFRRENLLGYCVEIVLRLWVFDKLNFNAEDEPTNYALMAFTSSSSSSFDNEEAATWVWGKRTWEGRERSFGTIPVLAGVQEGV
nr:hypothetical protein [Tanacetum cinerariifolium]